MRKLANIKKIAVLRANALGDFIFVLPALQALRETYRNAEIVYLGRPWHKDYFKGRNLPFDRVIVIPKKAGVGESEDFPDNEEELNAFFKKIKKEKFDLAIQLHGGGKHSNPFLSNLGAKVTLGLRTLDAQELDLNVSYVYYQNEFLRYLDVVSKVGAKTKNITPTIEVNTKDLREVRSKLPELQYPFAVIHPSATDPRRMWPAEKFAQVADLLSKNKIQVVIIGVEDERETTDEVISKMKYSAINSCGRLSLNGLTGLLSLASVVIANDSGPLHLASAVGTPTVGIFWCGNLINASHLTYDKFRPIGSWTINCPLCGADLATIGFPFRTDINNCEHLTSFVENVSVKEVAANTFELLAENDIYEAIKDVNVDDYTSFDA